MLYGRQYQGSRIKLLYNKGRNSVAMNTMNGIYRRAGTDIVINSIKKSNVLTGELPEVLTKFRYRQNKCARKAG